MSSSAASLSPETRPEAAAGWVVLAIDKLWLALPQRDVRQFELASDMAAPADPAAPEAGRFIGRRGESWPVYSLDESLELRRTAPAARHICAFFETEGGTRGVLCDRVWTLARDAELAVEPVPGCMTGPPSPSTGLAQFRDRIVLVTGRAALSSYIAFLLERSDAERDQ
jgi:hypothetical protein